MVKEMEVGRINQLTNDAIDVITERKGVEPPNEDVKRLIISLLRTLKRTYPKNFREVLRELVVKS